MAAAVPGRLPAPGTGRPSASGTRRPRGPLPGQDRWPPADLDDVLTGPLQDLRTLLAENPELVAGQGLAAGRGVTAGPERTEEADPDGPARTGREVLKAGFWDRTRSDGAGMCHVSVVLRRSCSGATAGWDPVAATEAALAS